MLAQRGEPTGRRVTGAIPTCGVAQTRSPRVPSWKLGSRPERLTTRAAMRPWKNEPPRATAPAAGSTGAVHSQTLPAASRRPKGLSERGYEGRIAVMNGTNTDPKSKANAYIVKSFGAPDVITGAALDKMLAEDVESSKALLKAALK